MIEERLYDWGYQDISAQAIQDAFEQDPEVRRSQARLEAYKLTQPGEIRIKALLKGSEERMFQKTVFATVLYIGLLSVVLLLGIVGYGLTTYNKNVRDLSFPEFRKRLHFDDSKTTASERSKYLLYFITKVIQLKPDMTAEVIADRLRDIGYSDATADAIRAAFQKDHQVRQSPYDKKAFQINPLAEPEFEERLEISLPSTETITLRWLWAHIPWPAWVSIILAILAAVSGSFYLGYRFALHSPKKE